LIHLVAITEFFDDASTRPVLAFEAWNSVKLAVVGGDENGVSRACRSRDDEIVRAYGSAFLFEQCPYFRIVNGGVRSERQTRVWGKELLDPLGERLGLGTPPRPEEQLRTGHFREAKLGGRVLFEVPDEGFVRSPEQVRPDVGIETEHADYDSRSGTARWDNWRSGASKVSPAIPANAER